MPPSPRRFSWVLLMLGLGWTSLLPGNRSLGQPKPAPPAIPPTYPTLTTPWNLGVKPGQEAELTLTGTNLTEVTGVWTSFNGSVMIPEGQKDAAKLTVKLSVPKDLSLGLHFLRVATKRGISNVRPITVDPFPEIASDGKNKSKATPQKVPVPCVITGAASNEAAEFFQLPVQANKPIMLEVLGRRLGSPIDPVMILYDGATGRELGGYYADDTPGLQSDARASYTPKADGTLIVEVRDTTYRGGGDFTYRLRLGEFPGAMTAYPLNVQRGQDATISFTGPDATALKPVSFPKVTDPLKSVVAVHPVDAAGRPGWPVPVRLSDFPELIEQEPNNELKTANAVPVPGAITARFLDKNDLDCFKFSGKKGVKYILTAETFERLSPAEVFLKVQDAKGGELTRSNPQNTPTRVEFTAPADGEFYAVCEHTNYLFGPSEVYRLQIQAATPDYSLTLSLDRVDAPVGGWGVIPVATFPKANGFNSPLELSLTGEDLSAKFTFPAGTNPQPATPVYVPFQVKAGAKPGPRVVELRASAKVDGQDLVRSGSVFDQAKAALNGIPIPPDELVSQLAVAVTPPPPFQVTFSPEKPTLPQGGTLQGKLSVKWNDKTDEVVNFAVIIAAGNINVKLNPTAKGKPEAVVEIAATPQASVGTSDLMIRATAKIGGQDVSVVVPPIVLNVTEAKKKEEPKKDEPKKK